MELQKKEKSFINSILCILNKYYSYRLRAAYLWSHLKHEFKEFKYTFYFQAEFIKQFEV